MMVSQGVSVRRACWIMGVSTAQPYRRPAPDRNAELRVELRRIWRPNRGYRTAHSLLKAKFGKLNAKRVHRIWKEEKLTCVKRIRKRRTGSGVPERATRPNAVWSVDFVHDACANGTKVKILTVLDEFTRECLALEVGTSMRSVQVRRVLGSLFKERGAPQVLRSDNGSEFTSKELREFLAQSGTSGKLIKPGSPWQNGYVESFQKALRRDFLDVEVLFNLVDAQVRVEEYRRWYNEERPHSSTGHLPPTVAARRTIAPGGVPAQEPPMKKEKAKASSTPEG